MGTNVVPMIPLEELPLSRRVSANIRAEIARSGLQQLDVARALGISQQAISLKLHDKRPLSIDEIETLAALFGMEPDELLRSPRRPFRPDGGGGQEWAPWGSNPRPTDYTSVQVAPASEYDATIFAFPGSGTDTPDEVEHDATILEFPAAFAAPELESGPAVA